jgi:branched-chain amino acid aminotransferase
MIVWIDGTLLDVDKARVSPLDRGLTVGDGVFETLRVYDGTPFALRRHLDRLRLSATGLGLEHPDPQRLRVAAAAVVDANRLREARLRITVTGGEGAPGSSRGNARPVTIVVATPCGPPAPTTAVVTVPWTRNENGATVGLKTLSYAANVRALAQAERRGATEALFANTSGGLCEGTGSNVFGVFGDEIVTPPPSSGCLQGVTRALVLELARDLGLRIAERVVPMGRLGAADEVFLTSTTREVQGVDRIDGRALPDAPGPVTRRLAQAYRDLVARTLDP